MKTLFKSLLCVFIFANFGASAQINTQDSLNKIANPPSVTKSTIRPDAIVAGSTRIDSSSPVMFLIGDSTVKCGGGKGEGGMWGWGSFFDMFFDPHGITVENHALGGRSSRTFITEGLWERVLPGIQKGDYLFIQFGHNDGGPMGTGRARASIKGIGDETEMVLMERDSTIEEVHTFGFYMRTYVRQAQERGAEVIILSFTPGNRWTGDAVNRCNETYGKWSKQIADEMGVAFIDLNDRSARKLEALGQTAAAEYFVDGVHNTRIGAIQNAESIIEGIRDLPSMSLNKYIK